MDVNPLRAAGATRAVSQSTARFTCIQPIQYICAEGCVRSCPRVAPAAGSGSASMPVALEVGSGFASCPLSLDIPAYKSLWSARMAGCRRRGQNSAILPALPRQRVVDLHLCPSSWKRAVDLRTARCMLLDSPVLYGKCVPTTRTRRSTRCSTTFIPPSCPRTRRSTRWGTHTSFTPRCMHETVLACGSVPYRGPTGSGHLVLL